MGHVDLGVGETRPVGAGTLPSPLPVSTEPDGLPAPSCPLQSPLRGQRRDRETGGLGGAPCLGAFRHIPCGRRGTPSAHLGPLALQGHPSPPFPTSRCLPDVPSLVRCRLWVSPAMTCGLLTAPPQPCTPTEAASGSSTLDLRSRCSGGRQDHCAAQHTPGGPAPRAAPFYGVVFGIPAARSSWGS